MNLNIFLLLLFFLSFSAVGEEIEVTIYVDDAYRPFSFSENGIAKGKYIDILKEAFSRLPAYKVTMVPIPWNRGKKMMEVGIGFALTPVFFHGHDWPYLYPYSLPINTEKISVICTEKIFLRPRANWPEDYLGLKIGNVAGFDGWGGPKFRDLVKTGKINYHEVQSSQALIEMILRGRQDCILMESSAFEYEFNRLTNLAGNNAHNFVKLEKGPIIGKEPVYIGYSLPALNNKNYPYAIEFQKAFDVVIYHMTNSGEIENIIAAYKD
ncbi:MAG: polar amino acid transport system substrate-binding protein [Colwellia sp.]|jgi:polar amino acid transport system substrate-binding protein